MKSFSDVTLADFLRLSGSNAPTPGGGSIAALAGCLGAAMGSMALNFTIGKEKYAEHEPLLQAIQKQIQPLINDLRTAIDDDAIAFSAISDAYKLPKSDDAEKEARRVAIDDALTNSMRVPLRIARCCGETAELLPDLARVGNTNLLSDVEVAGIMLVAGARAALVNVFVNSRSLKSDEAREAEAEAERVSARVMEVCDMVHEIIRQR